MESGVLRAQQAALRGRSIEAETDLVQVAVAEGLGRVLRLCQQALAASGSAAGLTALGRLLPLDPPDTVRPRRRIAGRFLDLA